MRFRLLEGMSIFMLILTSHTSVTVCRSRAYRGNGRRRGAQLLRLLFVPAFALGLHSQALSRQVVETSYYAIVKRSTDILIVQVERIEGRMYGQKAIAHIERSLKGVLRGDSVDLPFMYTSWPGPNGTTEGITEFVPITFEVGKRYVVLLTKWHRMSFNPYAAEAEYEVLNYPDRTFFVVAGQRDPRVEEIERLLEVAGERDDDTRADSLLFMAQSEHKNERIDAIEALCDLKSEKAVGTFVSMLRSDPDSLVRFHAARALAYARSTAIDSVLTECLVHEKTRVVRYQAVWSLGARKVKSAVPLLLGLYETEVYDVKNAILGAFPAMGDSTYVPQLLHLYSIDSDRQHRREIAQIVAGYHTAEADEFSSALLDTARSFYLKSAVIEGWTRTNYKSGFDRLSRWTSVPCSYGNGISTARAELQGLVFPLLRAIGKLGTTEQIASTLKVYSSCDDEAIRQDAVRILREQLSKDITAQQREAIEEEIRSFKVP